MSTEFSTKDRIRAWCRKWLGDSIIFALLIAMILWIIILAAGSAPNKAGWLLVPVTAIYSLITLWMAAAAFRSAQASERSARAMEASVEEQRLSRWASFAAQLTFVDGLRYHISDDNFRVLVLANAFRQPILGLQVFMWDMEIGLDQQGKLRFSSMMESEPRDYLDVDEAFNVILKPSTRIDQEKVQFGEIALERFRSVFGGNVPQRTLCLINYVHRASWPQPTFLVYDMQPTTTIPTS